MVPKTPEKLPVVGWREWVGLPEFGVRFVKAKIDTGARTSSLHVIELEKYTRRGTEWARFLIHPLQRETRKPVRATAEVLEYRRVRSSGGHASLRPVVVTDVELLGRRWPIEVTLANRDEMGFRMLLGREAIRRRLHVDPGASYYSGRPPRKIRKRKKRAL